MIDELLKLANLLDKRGFSKEADEIDELLQKFAAAKKQPSIKRKGKEWQVVSAKGKNMGTYKTEPEAKKRLKQLEMFQKRK